LLSSETWTKRWTHSSFKKADGQAGEFKLTAGKWYADEKADMGIQTGPDSKFFAISAEMKKKFDNTKKDLVLQVPYN
jgi:calreticulin